jgi:hypothetical protein
VFAHETDKSRKLLLKTGQTGLSGFVGTDGGQEHRWASMRCFFSDQVTSEHKRCVIHDNFGDLSGG